MVILSTSCPFSVLWHMASGLPFASLCRNDDNDNPFISSSLKYLISDAEFKIFFKKIASRMPNLCKQDQHDRNYPQIL